MALLIDSFGFLVLEITAQPNAFLYKLVSYFYSGHFGADYVWGFYFEFGIVTDINNCSSILKDIQYHVKLLTSQSFNFVFLLRKVILF